MLDISEVHPFEACVAFAVRWLGLISDYDLEGAEALIDFNDSGLEFPESFPRPEGFIYAHPDRATNWTMHIVAASESGLSIDFDLPFEEEEYRPMMARFRMRRQGDQLEVRFEGVVPS